MADLSVIIVNYNSGWFCINFIDSLLDQEFKNRAGDPGELQIVVVDNLSPEDQHAVLDPLEQRGVKVVYSKTNAGYASGANQGMPHVDAEFVLIANPDVVLLPGALQILMNTVYSDDRIGMVGPRGWLDPGYHFFLPPVERARLSRHLEEVVGRTFKPFCRHYSFKRSRRHLAYWSGGGTLDVDAISGYCALLPTALARELGPFDTNFPFYYEDDDLSLRVAQAGYRLVYVKDARAVHYFNKSAGPVFDEVIQKYYVSKSYFFRKHYGKVRHVAYTASTKYMKRYIDKLRGAHFFHAEPLGKLDTPLEIVLPDKGPFVVELTMDRAFVIAAGHLHPGGTYRIPDLTWDALDPTTFFLRILDSSCRRLVKAVVFEKTTPGKLPPTYAELKEDAP